MKALIFAIALCGCYVEIENGTAAQESVDTASGRCNLSPGFHYCPNPWQNPAEAAGVCHSTCQQESYCSACSWIQIGEGGNSGFWINDSTQTTADCPQLTHYPWDPETVFVCVPGEPL